jgi:glycosyltransferase involved in cell wall biosynthesis
MGIQPKMTCTACGFDNQLDSDAPEAIGRYSARNRMSGAPMPRNAPLKAFNREIGGNIEVSVVIPCLNEADTIGDCVIKAKTAIFENGIAGEVIVADNGSSDDSARIARSNGARVVPVASKGYGNALMGGIAASQGRFVIMGDADGSYDFSEIPRLLDKLRDGYELVQGCRLPGGGGRIMPGAMPTLHRWVGNPVFSMLAGMWFKSPIHDVYCGLRGFTVEHYHRLSQKCIGMEFATEMIIKSCALGAKIAEVPITLYPDGRKSHPPHLRTFRDGWRTLRFFLLSCPRWLFLIPGIILIMLGIVGYALALPAVRVSGVTFDAHTLLFGSLAILCGFQSLFFGVFAKALAIHEGVLPEEPGLRRILQVLKLERGLMLGGAGMAIGLMLLLAAIHQWAAADYGPLNYAHTMRFVVPGSTLTALGFQTVISCFFLSLLDLRS